MPTVPDYERNQLLRPAYRQGIEVQASPEAFGAGIGRGLQQVAGGLADVGDTLSAIQTLEAENTGRERTNAAMGMFDSILYDPETGYKSKSGRNALDARSDVERRIRDVRRQSTQGLSGEAARVTNRALDALERDALRTVTLHAGSELKTYTTETIENASTNFQNQALLHFNDKPLFDKYSAAALGSVDRMADLQGWSDEQRQAKRMEVQSSITRRAALRIAEDDPLLVEAFIEQNADNLSATDRYDLETALRPKIEAAEDERDLRMLIGGDVSSARLPEEEYAATIIREESGGDPTATNPDSSAAGLGQFLDATWIEQVRKHKPALAHGLTDSQILALRTDASPRGQALQREIILGYANENGKILRANGLPVNPATLHMAHFLGPTGASKVLRASDDTLLADVVSPDAIRSNRRVFTENRTVGDLKSWAADRAMGAAVQSARAAAPTFSMERDASGYWQMPGVEYQLEGKTRSKPVSKQFLERTMTALAELDPSLGITIISGGQAPRGSGGARTGSTRHDVDHSGHAHTADFFVTQNGRAVMPGENPELYAQVMEQMAAAGFTGIGHYNWGIHVGGGSEAAWGPDTSSATLDPRFAAAIERGRARYRSGAGVRPVEAGSVPVSTSAIEQRAMAIEDPIRRAKLLEQAYGLLGSENERRTQAQTAARDAAWAQLSGNPNMRPTDLPVDLIAAMGPSNFSSLSSAADALKGDPAESDPTLLYDIRRQQGNDPTAFAQRNLLDDFASGRLSRDDFDSLAKEQASALADTKKANQDSVNISTAMSIADAQLEAVGIKKTPSNMKDEDRVRVARFQNALMDEMAAFQQANQRVPSQPEIQSMINKLLLPVITSRQTTYQPLWPLGEEVETTEEGVEGFMFEAPFRPDGSSVDIVLEYEDIPAPLREGITNDLTVELGRRPTPDEVVERYELFVMTQ